MIVLELFVLLLKIPPVLVRNYAQDWKWVKGWVVKAIGHLVRVQNGKVIRRHQDQICRRTEQFSATTVNSPEQFDSNESLLSAPTSTFVSPPSPVPLHRYPQRTCRVLARLHESVYVRQ